MAATITANDLRRVVPGHPMEIGRVPFEGLVVMMKGMEMVQHALGDADDVPGGHRVDRRLRQPVRR